MSCRVSFQPLAACLASLIASTMLAACASNPDQPPRARAPGGEQAEAMLQRAPVRPSPLPPRGEPGIIAATDRAFARAARETGLWSAYRQYAAGNAMLHLPTGVTPASDWLAGRANPAEVPTWSPSAIWTSCDGTLAASTGRFTDPDGTVGSYAATWVQQGNSYRYAYKLRGADDPQPPPRARPAARAADADTIVVPGIDSVEGRVAECLPRGSRLPPLPLPLDEGGEGLGPRVSSADGTLHYRWQHLADGARRLEVVYLRDGRWQTALDFALAGQGAPQ